MSTCVRYLNLLQAKADERRIVNKVLGRVGQCFIYRNNRHPVYRNVQGFDFKYKKNPVFLVLQMFSLQYTRKKKGMKTAVIRDYVFCQ